MRYRDDARRERSQSFVTEREALRFRAQVETQLADGEWLDPTHAEVRLGQWVELWQKARVTSRTTAAAEESLLRNHVLPSLGGLPLRALTKLRVQTWVTQLQSQATPARPARRGLPARDAQPARPLAPASVAKAYRLLASALAAAVDEGLIRQSPCRGIQLPRAGVDERVFCTADQVGAVLEHVQPRYRALVLLAYLTGMRWSELAGLRVKRLDLLRGRLEVAEVAQEARGLITFGPPKSKASRRVITLPPAAVEAIAAHLAEWPAGRDALVFTSPMGHPLSRSIFRRRVWLPAVEAAGLDVEPTFHALRHSHVAALIADGAPMKAVQRRVGHGSIRVTYDTYGHLEDSVDEALLDGLQRRAAQLVQKEGA